MVKSPEKEQPSKCIACGICVKACPMDVLEIKEA
jgi:ferredoxin